MRRMIERQVALGERQEWADLEAREFWRLQKPNNQSIVTKGLFQTSTA